MSTPESTPARALDDAAHTVLGIFRRSLLVSGILALIAGLAILIWPEKTAQAVTVIVAIYAIVSGLSYVFGAFTSRFASAWHRIGFIVLGALFIIAGVVALSNLGQSSEALFTFIAILIGVMWIFEGVMTLAAVPSAGVPGRGWILFAGIVTFLAGISLLFVPLFAAMTLWIFLGSLLLVIGIFQIIRALSLRTN